MNFNLKDFGKLLLWRVIVSGIIASIVLFVYTVILGAFNIQIPESKAIVSLFATGLFLLIALAYRPGKEDALEFLAIVTLISAFFMVLERFGYKFLEFTVGTGGEGVALAIATVVMSDAIVAKIKKKFF